MLNSENRGVPIHLLTLLDKRSAQGGAGTALVVPDGADFTWVWIGRHADYDELLKRR